MASSNRDWLYAYDSGHRLDVGSLGDLNSGQTGLTTTTQSQDWNLDALGNWSGLVQTGTGAFSQARSHNLANEVSTATGWTTTAHDAVGNMTTMPQPNSPASGYTCVYDAWNRLVKVSAGSTTVAEYEYDGLNRRIVKSLGTGTVKEHYYFNEEWQELEVRQENFGTESAYPREQFVWQPYYIDAFVTRFYDSDVNNPTGVNQHYFTHDANFNVTAAVDTSGNVVERYDYSPYGEVIYLDGSFGSLSASTIAQSRTYTGQRLDSSTSTDTGLYQYRNRYYHARLGRFISRDPIGYEGSKWSLYEYVDGRPITETDSSGKGPNGRWIMCGGRMQSCPPNYGCYGGEIRPVPKEPFRCANFGNLEEVWRQAERRRGVGPLGDSAQHCWFACMYGACLGIGQIAAIRGDIRELPNLELSSFEDMAAHHLGGGAGNAYSNCRQFPRPIASKCHRSIACGLLESRGLNDCP